MMLRASLLAVAVLVAAPPVRADFYRESLVAMETADRVVLRKSDRRLALYRGGREIRSYRVSLGLNPRGHKEREGDFRTPEGSYRLTRRNPESDFFLAIQVSYPGDEDLEAARRNGVRPGGAIMIHGLPNVMRHSRDRYLKSDWTDGCIALSNEDMLEVWLLTRADTPIEILP